MLDAWQDFSKKRRLPMNLEKTEMLVFEPRCTSAGISHTQSHACHGPQMLPAKTMCTPITHATC